MDCEEIIFFEKLGFGWAVNKGVVTNVFPEASGKRQPGEQPITCLGLDRRKPTRR